MMKRKRRTSDRHSTTPTSSSWVYPKECNICKKYKIQHKGKAIFPETITTQNAVNTVKLAAKKPHQEMYFEIKDLDLIAKEFKYHQTPCYKNFTKEKCTVISIELPDCNELSETKGDFKAVEDCIKSQIIMQQQAVSMITLHELYGVHPTGTRYRSKLKKKNEATFPNQLCFLTAKVNTAEIVISVDTIHAHKNDLHRDANILRVAALDRPHQAKNLNELKKMVGLNRGGECYKPLRPSQIIKSEKLVTKVVSILENEYINPFGFREKDELINISSGLSLPEEISEVVLFLYSQGSALADCFAKERIMTDRLLFHNAISRYNIKTFQSSCKSVVIKRNNTTKSINVDRNILGALVSYSIQSEKAVDREKALEFPLSPVPLSIANADGSRRQTSKSKLMEVLNTSITNYEGEYPKQDVAAIIIDFISLVRTVVEVPSSFEGLALKILNLTPSGYPRVDLVADTYRIPSIKNSERINRGESAKILMKSISSKIPSGFKKFLSNGENKSRMIDLVFDYLVTNKEKVIDILRTSKLVLSNDTKSTTVTRNSTHPNEDLKSNQEEAGTKVVLHCENILQGSRTSSVILRSHSGDTDINVLLVGLLQEYADRIYLDYGSGKNRKGMWMDSITMSDSETSAIIAFHAFTGNDFTSSFFRKGNKACWKIMSGNQKFGRVFSQLGVDWNVNESIFKVLAEFTCKIYGSKEVNINDVRSSMFRSKCKSEHKIPDISVLSPCRSVLKLHTLRANYVACIWKRSLTAMVDVPPSFEHGWNPDGTIHWIDIAFPDSLE